MPDVRRGPKLGSNLNGEKGKSWLFGIIVPAELFEKIKVPLINTSNNVVEYSTYLNPP